MEVISADNRDLALQNLNLREGERFVVPEFWCDGGNGHYFSVPLILKKGEGPPDTIACSKHPGKIPRRIKHDGYGRRRRVKLK